LEFLITSRPFFFANLPVGRLTSETPRQQQAFHQELSYVHDGGCHFLVRLVAIGLASTYCAVVLAFFI
jgi:hypothetical protein